MPVAAKNSTVPAKARKSLAAPAANSTHNFGNGNTKKQSLANQKELSIGLAATIATTAAAAKKLPQTGTKPKKLASAATTAKAAAGSSKPKMESKPKKATSKPRIKSEPKQKPKVEAKKLPATKNRRGTLGAEAAAAAAAAVKQQLGSASELQLKDIDRLVKQLMGTNQLTDALKKQKQELEDFIKRELEKDERAKHKYAGKPKHKGNSTSMEDDESDDYSCDCSNCRDNDECDCSNCRDSDECDCSYCRNPTDCSCSYCNASSKDSKFTSAIGSSIDDSYADTDTEYTIDDDSDSFSDEFATSTDDSADEAKIDKNTFSLAALGAHLSKAGVAKAATTTSKQSKSKNSKSTNSKSKKGKSTTAANKKKKTGQKKSAAAKKRKNSVCPRN